MRGLADDRSHGWRHKDCLATLRHNLLQRSGSQMAAASVWTDLLFTQAMASWTSIKFILLGSGTGSISRRR